MRDFFWIVLFAPLFALVCGLPIVLVASTLGWLGNDNVSGAFGIAVGLAFLVVGYALALGRL